MSCTPETIRSGQRGAHGTAIDAYRPMSIEEQEEILRLRREELLPLWKICHIVKRTRWQVGRILDIYGVRTRKSPASEERAYLGVYMSVELHRKIKSMAMHKGSNMSTEAEAILRKRFEI